MGIIYLIILYLKYNHNIICGSRIMLISHIYQGQYQVLTSILKGTDVVVDESGS